MMENPKKTPVDLIIKSFKGTIGEEEAERLEEWLEVPGNRQVYEKLWTVWTDARDKADAREASEASEGSAASGASGKAARRGWTRLRAKIIAPRIAAGFAAAAVLAGAFVAGLSLRPGSAELQAAPETRATKLACVTGKTSVTLPDGTLVMMKDGAMLEYDTDFGKKDRAVTLYGNAYFDVARDSARMFRVRTSGMEIDVHGTAFNVADKKGTAEVSLLRGSVSVSTIGGKTASLVPGQKAVYSYDGGGLEVREGDVELDALWTKSSLRFDKDNLGKVCRYLSEWYGVEIVPDGDVADEGEFSFKIDRKEALDSVLKLMDKTSPIGYEKSPDGDVRIFRAVGE